MKHSGVWVMGDLADDDRGHGMGIVVEYAGKKGKPQWVKPKPFHWDYAMFGKAGVTPSAPGETIEMTIVKNNAAEHGFNRWTLNGQAFFMDTMTPMFTLNQGQRYRLKFRNAQRRYPSAAFTPAQLRAHPHRGKADGGRHQGCRYVGWLSGSRNGFRGGQSGRHALSLSPAIA
jgi:hypothetical protein